MPKKEQRRRNLKAEDERPTLEPAESAPVSESELVSSAAESSDESTQEIDASSQFPLDHDMEAAMEEDIAGEATGVSRRNPGYTGAPVQAEADAPSMDFATPNYSTSRPMARSGAEEAEWFNRFRERLAGASTSQIVDPTPQSSGEQLAQDPDDPHEDEAQNHSEYG